MKKKIKDIPKSTLLYFIIKMIEQLKDYEDINNISAVDKYNGNLYFKCDVGKDKKFEFEGCKINFEQERLMEILKNNN